MGDKHTKITCRGCNGQGSITEKVAGFDPKTKKHTTVTNKKLCTWCNGLGFQWVPTK